MKAPGVPRFHNNSLGGLFGLETFPCTDDDVHARPNE